MSLNPWYYLKYYLYLLQLENFELKRYFMLITKIKIFKKFPMRQELVWTAKIKTVFVLSVFWSMLFFYFIAGLLFYSFLNNYFAAICCLLVILFEIYFYFIFYIISTLTLLPLDIYIKNRLKKLAKEKMNQFPALITIGIAGSYGKTTMKEILSVLLSIKYKILKTPENINTSLGISRLILSDLDGNKKIFITEMGEFYPGDLKEICDITPPNITVITGINEAHFERLKTLSSTISTIFETVKFSKSDSTVFLNVHDENIKNSYKKYCINKKVFIYGNNIQSDKIRIKIIKFHEDGRGQTIDIFKNSRKLGTVKIPFIGGYILGTLQCAIQIASILGLTDHELLYSLSLLRPITHRLETNISNKDVLIIDDSYNGNPEGVKEAITALSKFKKRRKIFVTPGLVEMGSKQADTNEQTGILLSGVADLVVLIKNSVTPYIASGLIKNNFPQDKIIWYKDTQTAHQSVKNIFQKGDVVLFQNDWTDNYL